MPPIFYTFSFHTLTTVKRERQMHGSICQTVRPPAAGYGNPRHLQTAQRYHVQLESCLKSYIFFLKKRVFSSESRSHRTHRSLQNRHPNTSSYSRFKEGPLHSLVSTEPWTFCSFFSIICMTFFPFVYSII